MKNLIFGIFFVLFCVSYKAQNVQIYNATTILTCDGGAILIDSLQFDSWTWFTNDSVTIIQQNGSFISGLCLGTYVLQLTSNGSSFYYTFTITGNTVDCSSFQTYVDIIQHPSSPSSFDGFLACNLIGGTAPFSFAWYNGMTTQNANGVGVGAYQVCVTDANGCISCSNGYLDVDTTLCANFTAQIDSIVNQNTATPFDGEIYVSVSGGTYPYIYYWNSGETTEDLVNLNMGEYWLSVQDANGCQATLSAIIDSNSYITNCSNFYANIQLGQNATSTTINDAYVQVGFTGGTGPYTIYQLNDTIISADTTTYYLYNLSYGDFCYQVEDANGCITNVCQYISYDYDCSTFSATVQTTDASTFLSGCNGSAFLQIQNGVAPYTVNNFQITGNSYNYTNLCTGFSSFNITDVYGCVISVNYTIGWNGDSTEVPPFININTYTGNISAEGSCDGSVYLQIIGGLSPYTVYDNNGIQVDQYQTGLCEGVYTNTIVDASGQTITVNYFIASPFNIIDNTIFPDSLVLDTLINNVLQNCVIDFSTLDTAFISNIEFISMDSVVVTWAVLDGNGTIEFIENYSLDAGFGVYELIFQVFCPQRATDKYLIVREQFKVGGSFLGMEEQTSNFNVYPNPVTDLLNIQLETNSPTIVSISDVTGKLVYQNNFKTELIQINTSELAKGQYFVTINNEQLTATKIIIK